MTGYPDAEMRKEEERVADLLLEALSASMGIDQSLWSDLEDAVKPIIQRLRPDPVKCPTCSAPMSYFEYYTNQGACGPCTTKMAIAYDEEMRRELGKPSSTTEE